MINDIEKLVQKNGMKNTIETLIQYVGMANTHKEPYLVALEKDLKEALKRYENRYCENWKLILDEYQHKIGKKYTDDIGAVHTFVGLVHGDDDYYYGMRNDVTGQWLLYSCVGALEGDGMWGFKEVVDES